MENKMLVITVALVMVVFFCLQRSEAVVMNRVNYDTNFEVADVADTERRSYNYDVKERMKRSSTDDTDSSNSQNTESESTENTENTESTNNNNSTNSKDSTNSAESTGSTTD